MTALPIEDKKPSVLTTVLEAFSVPYNAGLPTLSVIHVNPKEKTDKGLWTFPALPDHLLDNRLHGGKNYKANIIHTYDARSWDAVPATVEVNQDAAFTLIDLDRDVDPDTIRKIEDELMEKELQTMVFFAAQANDFTKRKRPFATEKIPTVSYKNLGKIAKLNAEEIFAIRETPRLGFWGNVFQSIGYSLGYPGMKIS